MKGTEQLGSGPSRFLILLLLNLLQVDHVHVEEGLLAQRHKRVVAEVKDLHEIKYDKA